MADYYATKYEDEFGDNEIDNPKYKFYLLYRDGHNNYRKFREDCKNGKSKKKRKNYDKLLAVMNMVGNTVTPLPMDKYRKEVENIYEFKSGDLRVYTYLQGPGQYLILGSTKGSQGVDLKNLKKKYNDVPKTIEIREVKREEETSQDTSQNDESNEE